MVVGRAASCYLPTRPHRRRLPFTSRSQPPAPRALLPSTSSSLAGCYRHLSYSMLPLCRPTPLAPLSSPCGSLPLPRPLCGRIPSRSASRPLAYVPCHTLRPRKPPHPNPPRVWLLVPLLSTSSCIGHLLPHDRGSTILLAGCLHVM